MPVCSQEHLLLQALQHCLIQADRLVNQQTEGQGDHKTIVAAVDCDKLSEWLWGRSESTVNVQTLTLCIVFNIFCVENTAKPHWLSCSTKNCRSVQVLAHSSSISKSKMLCGIGGMY